MKTMTGLCLGAALVALTAQRMPLLEEPQPPTRDAFWECWFWPFPWCAEPEPPPPPQPPKPRPLEPDVPQE